MMLSENLARYEPYMGTILSSVVAVVVAVLVWNHFNYSIKVCEDAASRTHSELKC